MTTFKRAEDLQGAIVRILEGDPCTLFAGAGTSAFAGLRTWKDYLAALADVLAKYEADLAAVMRKRVSRGQLLEAAHSYLESTDMPVGEKYKQLTAQLKTDHYDPYRLVPLASLPFEAIVTTNYDRALIEAWARHHRKAPYPVERNDPTMKAAPFLSKFFVARIHGREEIPEDIVLETRHYEDLERDTAYQDFLHTLFLRRRCVFLGFSFLDPAINSVLDLIKRRGIFPKQHYAIAPSGSDALIARLASANIEVLLYDDRDHHAVLWRAIEMASSDKVETNPGPGGKRLSAFETARRLLAVCYTRARLGKDIVALRTLVVEGIIISLIDSGKRSAAELRTHLRGFLAVNDTEADTLIQEAVSGLKIKQILDGDYDRLKLAVSFPEIANMPPIKQLVQGTLHRLMVRDRYEPSREIASKLGPIIEEVIVLRGWDLGAEYAGAHVDEEISPLTTIQKAIERRLPDTANDRQRQIAEALLDLMRRPSPKEENALGELGRLAFGIEVILQAGRSTMYSTSFPDTVYLDTSVLMPAITLGHPYRDAYWKAIRTVQEKVGAASEIYLADVFLEEIYLHRSNAVNLVDELKLNDHKNLRAFISYFSPTNTNVFVGAYSTYVAQTDNPGSFSKFLRATAPYQDEKELVEYLDKSGIRTAWTKTRSAAETKRYAEIRSALLEAYDVVEAESDPARKKKDVLKQHEAAQLALLEQAIEAGRRAVFVTADNKLRRAVRASRRLKPLLDPLISHLGLIQLVDLLVGLDVDPGALRRLLWTVQMADAQAALKSYLLTRALEHYDAAMLYRMGDLLDEFVHKYANQAEMEAVQLTGAKGDAQPKAQRFLDRIDDEFFAYMAGEMKKLKDAQRKR